jgi:CRP/FNR family transcriptional regulator
MPKKTTLKAGIKSAARQGEVSLCDSAKLNQDGRCAGCCLKGAQPESGSENLEWKLALLDIAKVELPQGAGLYQQGETGVQVFSLRSGLVKLVQRLPNGTERIVRVLRGGGDIAGLEIFRQPRYWHTAIALVPVHACQIPQASMSELVRLSPRLYEKLMDCRERNLEMADWWIVQLSTGPVDARTARLIRYLKQADESAPADWVMLPQRDDMASMLGVATETLCRTLAGFQQAGALRRVNNRCYEFDPAAIDKLALR